MKNKFALQLFLIVAWLILFFIIAFSPAHCILDEAIYYQNIFFKGSLFTKNFIVNYKGTAGLAATWLFHFFPHFVTENIVLMRLVFFGLLVSTIFLLQKKIAVNSLNIMLSPFLLIAVPGVASLALRCMGDFPPVLLGFLYFIFFEKSIIIGKKYHRIFFIVCAAICANFAIVGKQPFLALYIFPVVHLLNEKKQRVEMFILALFMSLLPAYVFSLWKGFAPASSKIQSHSLINIAPFIVAFSWLSIAVFIINTEIVLKFLSKKKDWLILLIVSIILTFLLQPCFTYSDYVAKMFNQPIALVFNLLRTFFSIGFGVLGIVILVQKNITSRGIHKTIAIFIACYFLTFLKIEAMQFRYAAATFPFVWLLFKPQETFKLTNKNKFLIGVGLIYNLVFAIYLYTRHF